ncbi:MAG: hypothetical protein EHM39_10100, partial [Chloroflexi bacterium]
MQRTEPVSTEIELAAAADVIELTRPPKGLWRETLERLVRQPSAIVGLVILGTLLFIAIFAPLLATHNPLAVLLDVPEEGAAKRDKPCIHLFGCPSSGDTLVNANTDSSITAAILNSTNSMMAAAAGNTLLIWDANNGKSLMTFDHENPITAVDWSPNDQKLLTAAGDEIYVWEVNRR